MDYEPKSKAMETKRIKFSELRANYLIIKQLLEKAAGMKIHSHKTRIAEDLGLWGDDNYFLLLELLEKHPLDFSNFEYEVYFESEASNSWLIPLLPILIFQEFILGIIQLFSLEWSKKLRLIKFPTNTYQDLSMGDLIVSLTEKRFTLQKNIRYILDK
jgi:hypothetical protein